jgi:hypothetical protein
MPFLWLLPRDSGASPEADHPIALLSESARSMFSHPALPFCQTASHLPPER